MSFISTAIDTLGSLSSAIAPLASPAISAAISSSMAPRVTNTLVPGAPNILGPAAGIGLGALGNMMGDPTGGMRSPFGSSFCIEPRPAMLGTRWPRLVQFQTEPGKVETYVRAPKPRYRVVTSSRRRRGGR